MVRQMDTHFLTFLIFLYFCCTGSPNHLEDQILECLEKFNHDPDTEIRRKAHKVMNAYKRTGKWNIL